MSSHDIMWHTESEENTKEHSTLCPEACLPAVHYLTLPPFFLKSYYPQCHTLVCLAFTRTAQLPTFVSIKQDMSIFASAAIKWAWFSVNIEIRQRTTMILTGFTLTSRVDQNSLQRTTNRCANQGFDRGTMLEKLWKPIIADIKFADKSEKKSHLMASLKCSVNWQWSFRLSTN